MYYHNCALSFVMISRKNINCTIDESVEMFRDVCVAAAERSIPVRAYVSYMFKCLKAFPH